jgi:hypothetical protein
MKSYVVFEIKITSASPSIRTFLACTPSESVVVRDEILYQWHITMTMIWKSQNDSNCVSPWLTAITSLLETIAIVSLVTFLISQPRRRGACNKPSQVKTKSWYNKCFHINQRHVCINLFKLIYQHTK